jgi:small subunit ribosomal protein S17
MATENQAASGQAAAKPTPVVRGRRQEKVGIVTSSKMQKTIVVKVIRLRAHRLYGRVMRITKKFYAHDESGQAQPGDTVRIVETRPMSKLKRWRLVEVVQRRSSAE